jgi:hypothetical protein
MTVVADGDRRKVPKRDGKKSKDILVFSSNF